MLVESLDKGKHLNDLQETFDTLIYIDFYIPSNLWMKHMVNQLLISRPRILQTEGHHLVAKQTLAGNERCFFLIHLVHPYLIIA